MKKIAILLLSILLWSCEKQKHEYKVEPDFDIYVQRFLDEALKHGKNFDLQKSGLIIQFGDNGNNNWAGLTHFEEPIRIEIDKANWDSWANSKNSDLLKEELVFHEMGHGILNRDHKNDLLQNGDWATIMRGGDAIVKSNNMNYRGFRKEYYINELFDINTAIPEWSLAKPVFNDNPNSNTIFFDDFNLSNGNWVTGTNTQRTAFYDIGTYNYQAITDIGLSYTKNFDLNTTNNFYIEIVAKIETTDIKNACGIVWAGSNTTNYYYFNYNKKGSVFIGNFANYGFYIELQNCGINPDTFNKLTIRKIGNYFYFSVNDVFIYYTDNDGISGNLVGFSVSGFTKIIVDQLQVTYLDTPVKTNSIKSIYLTKSYEEEIKDKNEQKLDY